MAAVVAVAGPIDSFVGLLEATAMGRVPPPAAAAVAVALPQEEEGAPVVVQPSGETRLAHLLEECLCPSAALLTRLLLLP